MAATASNFWKKELLNGTINANTDVFKIILMQDGFTFNRATMGTYASVSASELTTANGYTVGGVTLTGAVISQDDILNIGKIVWNNVSWVASGGSLIPRGACIFDDTHGSDCLVGYIDFGSVQTTLNGGTFTVANIYVYVGQGV